MLAALSFFEQDSKYIHINRADGVVHESLFRLLLLLSVFTNLCARAAIRDRTVNVIGHVMRVLLFS